MERDYLEVGNYLEFVFPAMGMRFISVNDNYDSDRNFGVTGGMDVAYKNLIYQLYSMDLSSSQKESLKWTCTISSPKQQTSTANKKP